MSSLYETEVYRVPLALQCVYGYSDEGGENLDKEEGSKILRGANANNLFLCDESEEDLRVMVWYFAEVYRRIGLEVNAVKNKVTVLRGSEGLEYEVCINGICLDHVSEFKYLG